MEYSLGHGNPPDPRSRGHCGNDDARQRQGEGRRSLPSAPGRVPPGWGQEVRVAAPSFAQGYSTRSANWGRAGRLACCPAEEQIT